MHDGGESLFVREILVMKTKTSTSSPGERESIRHSEHRTAGSRESQRPAERRNQERKHGRHAGPRKDGDKAQS